ncbi:MAG: F0F1 ATP synthase subunit B [Bacteroides sp.]|nr:F0F1 ATP synthase subunit B [Barnesiella sp.]MBD5314791.1 F0F1 ATP synthase subunit B [Bacteroides sp.]MDE6249774.1 F0F1 ATP synthase subunit B [Paramuribaculum sp.]MDE7449669.1 F0F1 ATP synthase subunit B [Paramuribaculum sp.]
MELFTPDTGLMIWMFIAFIILFFILWKWGWPAIIQGVNSRADLIDKGVEYAQNAKEQLDNARAEADKYIADARRQQADMLREADKMKSQIIEEARNAAQQEAQKVMDAAKVSIEQERKQAELQFRNEVSAFALDIATKVVRNQMKDQKAQAQLVNTLLDDMEKQNSKN